MENYNLFDLSDIGSITITKKQPKKTKSNKIELADTINLNGTQLYEDHDIITKEIKQVEKAVKPTNPKDLLKSKKLTLEERLAIINENVLKTLGKQKQNVLVIKDRATFHDYVSKAIAYGRIAVDTETNNSLDPVTCKLMGPCLYVPGEKQVYIPLNHRDPYTKVRLPWQLTEQDCKEEFQRLVDAKIDIIMHNGKFDYEVIKCTCDIGLKPTWDTMVAARLLNENELANLKSQYIKYIDKSQSKYDIEGLFTNIAYADVDPSIFALYAATDSLMTDKLYELQKAEFDKPEYGPHMDLTGKHKLKGLRWLFHEIEMPIVVVTADMELNGVAVDEELGARLKSKYEAQLDNIDGKINAIIDSMKDIIADWRLQPENARPTKVYLSKKSTMEKAKAEEQYPETDEIGRFKWGKSRVEQLENPVNLSSPTQLAILFYDILGVQNDAKDGSRKTGKDELKSIKEKLAAYLPKVEELEEDDDLEEEVELAELVSGNKLEALKKGLAAKLADLLLKRRGIAKLVTTYIDVIPDLVKHWPDGRIRFHLNSLGTDTGRYSSGGKLKFMENEEQITVSGINIQNIPSRGDGKITRLLFKAPVINHTVECTNDDYYEIPEIDEVETTAGWKYPKDLAAGDVLVGADGTETIYKIETVGHAYRLYI